MSKPKLLVLGEIEHAEALPDLDSLSSLADIVYPKAASREDFIQECKSGALDGVLVIYRTFASADITGRFDEEIIDVLPRTLRFIAHNGAGYDQISVPACTKRKIYVSNVPTAVDDATADTAAFLVLGALRGFASPMHALRRGDWRGKQPPPLGHDPEGKLLGILGMGGIGRNLATKMRAFGMSVQYHNRNKLDQKLEAEAKWVSFEELLKTSDVLHLSLPLSPKTRHIISTEQFRMMKPSVVIINTARGAVMDEAALVEALNNGTVASVGLDVYEEEPKIHPGLVENENVLLLPHMGTWTKETQIAMERWNLSNCRQALEKGTLRSRVGEQSDLSYD